MSDVNKCDVNKCKMKIQREVIVHLDATEMSGLVRDYLSKEGLETQLGDIEFKTKAHTEGYGRSEYTTYEFDKCVAKCKIITERR